MSTTVKPGEKGKFTCSIAGNPRPPVVWLTGNGTVVKQSSRLSIRVLSYTNNETRSQLTIRKATAKDDGYYYCDAVVGGVGAVKSKSAKLTVKKSSSKYLRSIGRSIVKRWYWKQAIEKRAAFFSK